MSSETQLQVIEGMLSDILEDEPALFLVEIKIKPTNNIKIYLDGDAGIPIEKCVSINRQLYKKIEAAGLYSDGDFSLEISSPGLDEPLKLMRQYRKNIGRKVEVVLKDGSKVEGKLKEVNDEGIVIEETRGKIKKPEIVEHRVSLETVKTTKIQIVF